MVFFNRKKVKAELKKYFPNLSDDELANIIPNKEEMSVLKIETHSGEVVSAHVVGKKPIIFHIRDALFPTVYLLWQLPQDCLPYLTTWYVVVPKFVNGAHLMLPGIIVNEELGIRSYGKLSKGQTIAVNTNYNCAAAAVGKAALSSEDMYMAGRRGKGVEILHCIGDFLWQLGGKETPPELGAPSIMTSSTVSEQENDESAEESAKCDSAVNRLESSVNQLEIAAEGNPLTDSSAAETRPMASEEQECMAEEAQPSKTSSELMDELLVYCFLKALRTSAKKIELPALTSNFFRLHMVTACPSDKNLDVKKSSYKKLSKFLEAMKSEGVVAIKELTKGVESITDINYLHDKIRSFRINDEDSAENQPVTETVKDDGKYAAPIIGQLYLVNAATLALFSSGSFR